MHRGVVVALVIATSACGRIGFDATDDGGTTRGPPRSQLAIAAPLAPLVDFPLLVVLDDTRAARDLMRPDASDLRFFDASGNVIPHEIERIGNPGGPSLVAWVRVPLIDGPTTISVDYGHGTPVPASTDSVWSDAYAAVYHLVDLHDSTLHGLSGTWMGGTETSTDAQMAKGHVFDAATNDAIAIADSPAFSFAAGITVSAWARPVTLTSPSGFNAAVTQEASGSDEVFWVGFEDSNRFGFGEIGTTTGFNQGGGGGPVTAGNMYHLALAYDVAAGLLHVYLDLAEIRSQAITGTLVDAPFSVAIGADSNSEAGPDDDFFDGTIDEVRIETVPRSAEWIAFDVQSMRDQLITYGPVGP